MPRVPGDPQEASDIVTQPMEQPKKEFMLMAAAAMRDLGRLYDPPNIPTPNILVSARREYWEAAVERGDIDRSILEHRLGKEGAESFEIQEDIISKHGEPHKKRRWERYREEEIRGREREQRDELPKRDLGPTGSKRDVT